MVAKGRERMDEVYLPPLILHMANPADEIVRPRRCFFRERSPRPNSIS
jgi:hypothetical protein